MSTASTTQQVTRDSADEIDHGRGARIGLPFVRITIGLLWIQSAGWKTPPAFGRDSETGLFKYSTYAVDYPVFGPFSWLMENVVLPNFTLFGYLTLLVEASVGAFLLVGLASRFWAIVGMGQTVAIALSVLNGPNEFPWTYYLLFAAHVVILVTASGRTAGLDGVLRPRWRQSSGRPARLLMKLS